MIITHAPLYNFERLVQNFSCRKKLVGSRDTCNTVRDFAFDPPSFAGTGSEMDQKRNPNKLKSRDHIFRIESHISSQNESYLWSNAPIHPLQSVHFANQSVFIFRCTFELQFVCHLCRIPLANTILNFFASSCRIIFERILAAFPSNKEI